jgi:hypothetical protein
MRRPMSNPAFPEERILRLPGGLRRINEKPADRKWDPIRTPVRRSFELDQSDASGELQGGNGRQSASPSAETLLLTCLPRGRTYREIYCHLKGETPVGEGELGIGIRALSESTMRRDVLPAGQPGSS